MSSRDCNRTHTHYSTETLTTLIRVCTDINWSLKCKGCSQVRLIDVIDIQLPDEKQYQYILSSNSQKKHFMEKWLDRDILNPILNLMR